MVILFLCTFFALLFGAIVLYVLNLHWWKVSLIAAVVFGAVAMMWVPGEYAPQQRLKGGIDLVGGTTLVYDVTVPEGQLASDVIERTMEVLAERVDPTGTRNLIWRRVAGQRIEVQMALANKEVRDARLAYDAATAALTDGNLTRGQLDNAIRTDPASRAAVLDGIAKDDAPMRARLGEIAELFDAQEAARALYEEAQQQWNAVPAELRADNMNVFEALEDAETAFINAELAFQAIETQTLREYAFSIGQFEMLVDLPAEKLSEERRAAGETTPREDRLAELKKFYPSHAGRLQTAYDALLAYEDVKGPLDDPQDLIALLQGSGVLEFRIAADPSLNHTAAIDRLDNDGPRAGAEEDYRWFEVDDVSKYVESEELEQVEGMLRDTLSPDETEAAIARDSITSFFESYRNVVARAYAGRLYVLLHNTEGLAMTRADNWEVQTVSIGQDELGRPTVDFQLDGRGSGFMQRMTQPNVGRPMAVLLDNMVLTSPRINQALSTNVQISGDFTRAEVNYLKQTMQAGALEGQLSELPVSQKTTGPQLGEDNLKAGIEAALIALLVVALFMMVYYFFGGVVANFALAVNMVLILGIMAMIQSTFTLPGIAGMVLTIGMAVDANVLIFERIREELMAKQPLEVAVRQGYSKALSTILDANITTLITCVILGYTATSEVKGFAVVLGIGILATLFTALFCTKVIIDLYVRYTNAKTLHMLPLAVPGLSKLLHPNVDWIKLSKVLVPVSLLLLVLGIAEAFNRGADLLDIEFRSGTQVGFEFKPTGEEEAGQPVLETLPIDEVRERINLFGEVAEAVQEDAGQASVADDLDRLVELTGTDLDADAVYAQVVGVVEQARSQYAERVAEYDERMARMLDMEGDEQRLSRVVRNVLDGGTQADVSDELSAIVSGLLEPQSADAYYEAVVDKVADIRASLPEPEPMIDYANFNGDNLVTTGRQEGSGYSASMLVTDSRGVTGLLKLAFGDKLETTQVVTYAGQELTVAQAAKYVQAITDNSLERVFDGAYRADDDRDDVTQYRGGVAIVVDQMTPPQSVEQVEDRIARMRRQPPHDQLGARNYDVVPLTRAAQGGADADGNLLYDAVVVVVKDEYTDYDQQLADFNNVEGLAATEWNLVRDAMQRDASFSDVTVFNSQVSGTMKQTALVAMFLSLLAVVAYIWVRFGSIRYGLAAIAALVHDVSISLGMIALAGWAYAKLGEDSAISQFLLLDPFKVNLAIVAAMLTIVGYSLNDTIVVFDRIRENRGRLSRATPAIINDSINQTISRTLMTSLTTFLAVIVLYVLGGPGVHGFAFAMVIGVLVGTYSSVAIASPILIIGTKGQGPTGGPIERPAPRPDVIDGPDMVSEPVV